MTREVSGVARSLLRDENGQTMLEYVTIVIFVVIVMFIAFRLVKGIISRSVVKASHSIEQ
jgi:Flp pilus assembly pilin Flp